METMRFPRKIDRHAALRRQQMSFQRRARAVGDHRRTVRIAKTD